MHAVYTHYSQSQADPLSPWLRGRDLQSIPMLRALLLSRVMMLPNFRIDTIYYQQLYAILTTGMPWHLPRSSLPGRPASHAEFVAKMLALSVYV